MSKIGRKPIELGSVRVDVQGRNVNYTGGMASGVYKMPNFIDVSVEKGFLKLSVPEGQRDRDNNRLWGLHRALLANALQGAGVGFVKQIQINGLGFKAALSGSKVVFTIGYTHKIDVMLPKGVTLEVDKTGQLLTFKSANRELLGEVCDHVRSLRPPEPYKGTGIKYKTEVIVRKAGKTKASAS